MPRIPAPQFPPQLRIEALPKPRQIGRSLHRPLIRRQQMHHQRHLPARHPRRLRHPKKILQPRRDPRRLPALIIHLVVVLPAGSRNRAGATSFQQPRHPHAAPAPRSAPRRSSPHPQNSAAHNKARPAPPAHPPRQPGAAECCRRKFHPRQKPIQFLPIHKPLYPRFHRLRRQQLRRRLVVHGTAARSPRSQARRKAAHSPPPPAPPAGSTPPPLRSRHPRPSSHSGSMHGQRPRARSSLRSSTSTATKNSAGGSPCAPTSHSTATPRLPAAAAPHDPGTPPAAPARSPPHHATARASQIAATARKQRAYAGPARRPDVCTRCPLLAAPPPGSHDRPHPAARLQQQPRKTRMHRQPRHLRRLRSSRLQPIQQHLRRLQRRRRRRIQPLQISSGS